MRLNFKFYKKNIVGYMFILFAFSGIWMATQTFAKYTGYHPGLGDPLIVFKGVKIYKPFLILSWLHKYSHSAPIAAQKSMQILFEFIFVGFFFVFIFKKKHSSLDTHGTARWANTHDIRESGLYLKDKEVEKALKSSGMWGIYTKRLPKEEHHRDGVVLGKDPRGREIIHNGVEHIMLMAPTRSGKGVGVIIPTLLTWKHSTIVNDIKGENYQLTKKFRETLGHKCLKFDPTNTVDSCRYNPLLGINKGKNCEYQDTRIIAEIICASDRPDHWSQSATSFLTGIILHIIYSESNPTLGGIVRFLTSTETNFEDKMELIMSYPHTEDSTLFENIYHDVVKLNVEDEETKELIVTEFPNTHPVAARVAGDMLGKADKERASIVSTALTKLGIYQDPIIDKNTSGSDFKVNDLMNAKVPLDLFLVTPPKALDVTAPLFRLIITQIIYGLTEEMVFSDGTENKGYKHRLLLLLDEFPALGKIPLIEKALAFIAGYGMKALLITQDINQVNRLYTKDNSVLSNCYITVFYTPAKSDHETPRLISNSLGDKTIEFTTKSWKGFKYLSDWNYSSHQSGRRLLTEGEVGTYSSDKNLILINGKPPIQGFKIKYYEDKKYLNRLKLKAKE